MAKIKYIMFDFDNTLVDSLKFWYDSIDRETFKFFGVKINKEFRTARKGLTNREICECFVKYSGIDKSVDEVVKFWHGKMIFNYQNKIKMVRGARETLETLKQMGYKLVLASATPMNVLRVAVNHFDLEKYFEKIYTEETLGAPKREPKFYENIMADLKISASELFVFEDAFVSLRSAGSLGIKSCSLIHKFNKNKLKNLGENNLLIIKNYYAKKLKTLPIFKVQEDR